MIEYKLVQERDLDLIVSETYKTEIGITYFEGKDLKKIMSKAIEMKELHGAYSHGLLEGYIWCETYGTFNKYPYIHMIIVFEAYRNNGIGRELLTHLERELKGRFDKVFIMVGNFNERVYRLYLKNGYNPIGVLRDFYREGIAERLLEKHL